MTERRDFLVELGTEELPPKALHRLSQAFGAGLRNGLTQAGLSHGEVHLYAAPRRLAIWVEQVAVRQPDRVLERRGPALNAAYDEEGRPTKAAQGFARSCGVEVEDLAKLETDKGAWLVFRKDESGEPAPELLPGIVRQALDGLPIPKRMRWGALREEFVRPVHWVVLLFGDEQVEGEVLGIRAGRLSRGHRFHHPGELYLGAPAAYAPLLETEGHVIADFAVRKEAIRGQALEAAARLGGQAVIDEDLLDEVTALVEWPVAVTGSFEEKFLEVPAEALISSMQGHQKYFPVIDDAGRLTRHFITISNIESREPEQIRAGNERVIRPRLSDAAFFWNQDRKHGLEAHRERLKAMVYQDKLGTLYDKAQRVGQLAGYISAALGGDPAHARRAADLGKCDLLTHMVYEFPELQGTMGKYYAEHGGEPAEVALALEEQYRPRFAGDQLPSSGTGQALALAERLDTLVGIFGVGLKPSGDKDPYALRRAALGVLRILVEGRLDLDLEVLLREARAQFAVSLDEDVERQVFDFVMDRLRGYYQDRGIRPDVIEAVVARRPTGPLDFDQRLHAVTDFVLRPEADSLAAANKRIRNILRKTDETLPAAVQEGLLEEDAKRLLAAAVEDIATEVGPLFDQRAYKDALSRLAGLRDSVDGFFEGVMVMAEDPSVRRNRLALLTRVEGLFLRVADFSQLQG